MQEVCPIKIYTVNDGKYSMAYEIFLVTFPVGVVLLLEILTKEQGFDGLVQVWVYVKPQVVIQEQSEEVIGNQMDGFLQQVITVQIFHDTYKKMNYRVIQCQLMNPYKQVIPSLQC